MSLADKYFAENCRRIINEGISDENLPVRPRWEDGTPAHTKKIFGVVNRYDLSKEFPMVTLRRTFWKSALDELLWIYQKKSNNISELASHVWDQWADEEGSIGKAYGYQIGRKNPVKIDLDKARALFGAERVGFIQNSEYYKNPLSIADYVNAQARELDVAVTSDKTIWMDQMGKVIYDLTYTPASRRIMHTTWNPADDTEMHLSPCAYSMTYNVTGNKLNAILNQRSQDMLAAGAWNICQYAELVLLVAKVTGFEPGELIHVIADCHIYDRHIPLVEKLLDNEAYDAPIVRVDPELKQFRDATKNSIIVENYKFSEYSECIPIAV